MAQRQQGGDRALRKPRNDRRVIGYNERTHGVERLGREGRDAQLSSRRRGVAGVVERANGSGDARQ